MVYVSRPLNLIRARSSRPKDLLDKMTDKPPPVQSVSEASEPRTPSSESKSGIKRLLIFALVVVMLFTSGYFLPVVEWLRRFHDWVQEQGAWGVVCFGI